MFSNVLNKTCNDTSKNTRFFDQISSIFHNVVTKIVINFAKNRVKNYRNANLSKFFEKKTFYFEFINVVTFEKTVKQQNFKKLFFVLFSLKLRVVLFTLQKIY